MRILLLFIIFLSVSVDARVAIDITNSSIKFRIQPLLLLDNSSKNNETVEYLTPNYPKVEYLSYLFIAPGKFDIEEFDVRLSVGKIENHYVELESCIDDNGVASKLLHDFRKPFYQIEYVKQLSGLHLYRINIFPFKYSVKNKILSYNSHLNIQVNFSQSLASFYHEVTFPQKSMFETMIINLNEVSFAKKRVTGTNLTKSLLEDLLLEKEDFLKDSIVIDYLVITDKKFIEQAKELCEHRVNSTKDEVVYPRYVTTETIYALYEASYGSSYQPKAKSIQTAILRLKESSSSLLTYVVLMGSGYVESWPQERENFIPAFTQTRPSNPSNLKGYLVSDDYMTEPDSVHSNPYPKTTFIGRIPARDVDDAKYLVTKIVEAENFKDNVGNWKNSVQLVADDDWHPNESGIWVADGIEHDKKLEEYIVKYIPNYIVKKRVYMTLHARDKDNMKPTATNDMVSGINNGVFMSIYSGHGGANMLADEKLFTVSNVPVLRNSQVPIFMFLSCNVGAFHGVNESLSEALVNYHDFGSNVVLAASEETYAGENMTFGKYVVKFLYENKSRSLGDIVNGAKDKVSNNNVALAYHLFGDPAMIVRLPETIDVSQNNTMYGDERVTTSTTVLSGVYDYEYRFFDALRYKMYVSPNSKKKVEYFENGTQLHSNRSKVTTALVSESFFAQSNIKYNDSTAGYTIYVSNDTHEYLYYDFSFNTEMPRNYTGNEINSVDGPEIKFFQVNSVTLGQTDKQTISPLHNSDELKLPAIIRVTVTDRDEICLNENYMSDAGYGGIPYSWDNNTSMYAYEHYNSEDGSFSIQLDSNSLSAGLHKLTVSAVDFPGNISKQDITLNIITPNSSRLISRIYTYPNPGKLPIKIAYQLLDKIYEGKIVIYNSRGKLLKSFTFLEENTRVGFNHITWDGVVGSGQKIGKGLYIAHIMVYKDAESKSENIKESQKFKFIIE